MNPINPTVKKIGITLSIIVLIIAAAYIGYRVYNNAVEDATRRIKQGVKEGVTEGVGEGIGGALNPLNVPGKIFGRN